MKKKKKNKALQTFLTTSIYQEPFIKRFLLFGAMVLAVSNAMCVTAAPIIPRTEASRGGNLGNG